MSETISLVFPHQLFEQHPAFAEADGFWLIEDELFFKQLAFHQKKLAFHRASMSYYAEKLRSKNKAVRYFSHDQASLVEIFNQLAKQQTKQIHIVDPTDFLLEKRIRRLAMQHHIEIHWHSSPLFLNTPQINNELLGKQSKRFLMADFYKKQRLRLGILVDGNNQPIGEKWSFDTENRKALPKGMALPQFPTYKSPWSLRAQEQISQEFANNGGEPSLEYYPVTHQESQEALDYFVKNNLGLFGPYQDAFSTAAPYVFHSNLSTALNVGLLTPDQVIDAALMAYNNGSASIESVEGFIRQVIGWREFIRAIYERVGVVQRTTNAMQHQKPLDWHKLGQLPFLNYTKHKLEKLAYAHHIERLMLLGNFFFLSEIHPDEVYRFFMVHYMDAYDWVMVPNVYGMSQYADGGLMTTKPYFSGSNYLKKQGFKFDNEGAQLFDALFWHFVDKHQERLRKNLRTVQVVANWNRMLPEKKAAHLERAALYFSI